MTFNQLELNDNLLRAVEDMGFTEPTEVQYKAIPHILNQEDLIVRSKTGSGKTAAFGLPILQHVDGSQLYPQALILTPTRELAVQVDLDLRAMSMHSPIKTTAVYGQHSMNVEIQDLSKGTSIVTGTPGRVFDHIQQKNLKTSHIRYLVLDEADKMLDMGFLDQVVRIIKTLPKDRVTMLFSATMPTEIQRICKAYMKEPVLIEIESDTKTVDSIEQSYYRVNQHDKRNQLERILAVEQPNSCMIFCNTRIAVDKVQEFLSKKGYPAQALHGAISQSSRLKTIQKFKGGGFQLLVATDVAARGIHVDDLALVINFDVPLEKDSYVHRIGRTGRAGSGGKAITLTTSDDIYSFYEIEEHVGVMIEEMTLPSDALVVEKRAEYVGKWANFKIENPHQERLVEDHHKKPGNNGPRSGSSKRPLQTSDSKRPTQAKAATATSGQKTAYSKSQTQSATASGQRPTRTQAQPSAVIGQRPTPTPARPQSATASSVQRSANSNHGPANRQTQPSTAIGQRPTQTQTPSLAKPTTQTKGRAYTQEEIAATLQKYQAKKEGKATEQKKGLFTKLKETIFGKK